MKIYISSPLHFSRGQGKIDMENEKGGTPVSEEYGPDFLTVTDEEGNEFELELVDTLEHNGITYHAFFPAVDADEQTGEPREVDADDEEYGLVIMKAVEEDGEELLSTLDTDEELDEIYQLFMDRFFEEEESQT